METDNVLQDASRIWAMLDEMSENDPEGYKKFIEKQLSSCRKNLSLPVIKFVIRVTLKDTKEPMYVNFCEWSLIPEPKSIESPLFIRCGEQFTVNGDKAIALAFSPKVFIEHNFTENLRQNGTNSPLLSFNEEENNRYQLIWLALHYLENEKHLSTIESNSIICSAVPLRPTILQPSNSYGTREQVFKSIGFLKKLFKPSKLTANINEILPSINREFTTDSNMTNKGENFHTSTNTLTNMTPENLFRLNASELDQTDEQKFSQSEPFRLVPRNHVSKVNSKPLIEDITTKIRADNKNFENCDANIENKINWFAEVISSNDQEKCGSLLKLTINLPGVQSGNQCDLDLSKVCKEIGCNNDLKLDHLLLQISDETVHFKPLDLQLPCQVNADLAEAKFNPHKGKLLIVVPILTN